MAEAYTGVIVALVPADSDPITTASSEPAHMTLAFLGDLQDFVPDLSETLVAEVENYARRLSGPVVAPVREVGKLGDDGADVAFLEPTESLVALRAGLLESASNVADMAGQHDKFLDGWTPHITLGYPERPQNEGYAGETVTFDRIAVWVGDEHHDFAMEGEMSEKIEASVAPERFVIEFDYRSDGGDRIVGPFDTREDAETYVSSLSGEGFSAEWSVIDLAAVVEEAEAAPDDEMPTDDLDEDEEEITEIPVHGIATIEGRPTGDGRGFRQGGLTIGELPQPLGYEFEHGHGSDNSRVAIVGRIDEFFRKEFDTYSEIRWRGVILTTKEYAAQAIESIVDGSYTGVSVVVDDVTVDVEGKREQMRQRIEADMAAGGDVGAGMDVEQLLDVMVGNGETEVTWFSSARVRRFDMVPTGAYQEAYIGLGHEFEDEMTAEQLEASAAALADCGCADELLASAAPGLHKDGTPPVCKFCDQPSTQYVLWAEGMAFIPACESHLGDAKSAVEDPEDIVRVGEYALEFAPGTKDGPGWITHPTATARIRRYWVRGKGAAKIRWGAPGDFNRCRRQLAKYVQNPEWLAGLCANMHHEALGIWPGQHRGKLSTSTIDAYASAQLELAHVGERVSVLVAGGEDRQLLAVARHEDNPQAEESLRSILNTVPRTGEGSPGFVASSGGLNPRWDDAGSYLREYGMRESIPSAGGDFWKELGAASLSMEGSRGDLRERASVDAREQDAIEVREHSMPGVSSLAIAGGVPSSIFRLDMHKEALGIWPGQHRGKNSLAASATPLFSITAALDPVDAKLFHNPQLTRGTGVVVDGDHIYGHIATWRSCHVGEPEGPGRCTLAPRSRTNYAHFRTGTVMTSEGPIAVGSITMDTGHAGPHDSPSHAVAHYDNTGLVVADVACGEDNFGIWFSGRIRPNVTDEKRFALAASGRLSGDWRRIGNSYELVAALVVNSAGFPVADASLAASAGMGVVSIIGEGIVDAEVASLAASAAAEPTLNPKTVEEIAAAAAISAVEGYMSSQKRSEIVDRMIPARRALSAHLIANARERLQQEMRMSS